MPNPFLWEKHEKYFKMLYAEIFTQHSPNDILQYQAS